MQVLEKTAIDIVKFGEEECHALVWIDYFTRLIKIKKLTCRSSIEIINNLKDIFEEVGIPEEINLDNAKEFTSKEIEQFYVEMGVQHHLTSVEKHTYNGRVERVIRTIRDGAVRLKNSMSLEDSLRKIELAYNDTLHSGIGMSPNEAWNDITGTINKANSRDGTYNERFKKLKREKFYIGQQVRIAQVKNLKHKGKSGLRNKINLLRVIIRLFN
ncbi:hypothetical protein PAEPH01_0115 [Pancytospora epiphaga]|nr:hypothetical protein PAEPH01_0115 [Pancytospora epiphaga]